MADRQAAADGLVLGESDFQRIYRSVNKYYFADLGSGPRGPTASHGAWSPTRCYLRQRIRPADATPCRRCSTGPRTGWIPSVVSAPSRAGVYSRRRRGVDARRLAEPEACG